MALSEDEKQIVLKAFEILIREAHQTAKGKGWWNQPRGFGDQIALMHSELSEALEDYRVDKMPHVLDFEPDGKPIGVPSEFADVLIRIFDTSGHYDIDLGEAVVEKLAFNETRPFCHGGKAL